MCLSMPIWNDLWGKYNEDAEMSEKTHGAKVRAVCFLTLMLFFLHYPVYAQNDTEREKKENDWVLAFSEFTLTSVEPLYESYKTILPELIGYNLGNEIGKTIPLEEKKMRVLLKLSQKKTQAISQLRELVREKDALFLLPEIEKKKSKKQKELEKKITAKQKELDLLRADITIENLRVTYKGDSVKAVVPWNEEKLFTRTDTKPLAVDLADNGISALVTGEITDVAGYAAVRIVLQTGLAGVPELTVTEAGRYEEIDSIAQSLALQIAAQLQSLPEHRIYFELEPKTAQVFVNQIEVRDAAQPLSVYANAIDVFACADGFKTATKAFTFGKEKGYRLKIKLEKIPSVAVVVDIDETATVYEKTQEQKIKPSSDGAGKSLEVPNEKTVLEFEDNEVRTFVLFDPEKIKSNTPVHGIGRGLNKTPVQEQIEKQRSVMYWSLGAVYLSLPATLVLTGLRNDKINAVNSGRLPLTPETMQKINNLTIASNVMIGVTSALAVNYFVQVILYLVKADAALPKVLR